MLHRISRLLLTLFLGVLGLQAQSTLQGDWQGSLKLPAGSLHLVLHLKQDAQHQWVGTLDSPDQQAYGLRLKTVQVLSDSLYITAPEFGLSYSGKLDASGKLQGQFAQGNLRLPLLLQREDKGLSQGSATQGARPSYTTPAELTPFQNEELSIPVPSTDVILAGTLTLPKQGKKAYPTVVLISGSGPQDRDETLFGKHKPFLHLTQALCEAGYAVFRFDDRGTARSTGDFFASRISDFVTDVTAILDQLKKRPEVRKDKLFLLGHSEGAYVASKVASLHHEVAGVISLAGPGLSVDRVLLGQLSSLAQSAGVTSAKLSQLQRFNEQTYRWMKDASLPLDSVKKQVSLLYRTQSDLPNFGMTESQLLSQLTPYLRELLTLDIAGTWRGLTCPVIGVYGSKDLQVLPENAEALQKLLPKASVRVIPGLNHLFLPCQTGSPAEYASLAPGFSPEALRYLIQELGKLR